MLLPLRARLVVIALILAFPTLLALASPSKAPLRNTLPPVALTTAVLVAGLSIANRERRLLLNQRQIPRPARQSTPARSPSTVS